jgi:hypothetical protein
MKITMRRGSAVAVALIVGGVCVASQPALAEQQGAVGSVTTREIKNGTIKLKDMTPGVKTKILLGSTALQVIPDASVTTQKIADDAVTGPKLAANSVGSSELGPNSVNSEELANDSVDTGAVANGSLIAADVASARGVANLDFPLIAAGSCQVLPIAAPSSLNDDLILITAGPTMPGIISVVGRQQNANSSQINVVACNAAGVGLNPSATNISWAVLEN